MRRRASSAGPARRQTADVTNRRSQSSAGSSACSAEHTGKAHAHPVRHAPARGRNANARHRGSVLRRANVRGARREPRRACAPRGLHRRAHARHLRKRTAEVAVATSPRPSVQTGLKGVESQLRLTGDCLVSKPGGSIYHVSNSVKLDRSEHNLPMTSLTTVESSKGIFQAPFAPWPRSPCSRRTRRGLGRGP